MPTVANPHVEWFEGITPERERREAELVAAGCPLPLKSRMEWARAYPRIHTSLLVVRDSTATVGALGLERHPSRALPGHYIARISRAGAALPGETHAVAVEALTEAVKSDSRALRVHFECFSRDAAVRERIGEALARNGFGRQPLVTGYEFTLATDLRAQDDASHLASLAQGVRQNIRALTKFPVVLRPVRDRSDAPRMNELMAETLARTGGRHEAKDYEAIIRLALADPDLSHLVGVYRTDVTDARSLIAFAWGVSQGEHVAYDIGASTRVPEFKNLSLGYPLLWELITWARARGAAWFDFGGVSPGTTESEDDRLGRISDFKRRFEKARVRVADDWMLEPHPLRARLAATVSRGVKLVEGLRTTAGRSPIGAAELMLRIEVR